MRISSYTVVAGALMVLVLGSNCGGGSGMRTGVAGSTGSSGATGNAGTTGTGGATAYTCPSDQLLDCANALTLMNGHVTDFSNSEWNNTNGKICDASGLRAAIYGYPGAQAGSTTTASVDLDAHNLKFISSAAPGDYTGGGIAFDKCVSVPSSLTALRFSAAVTGGSQSGCTIKAQLKTFEQQAMSQTPAGGCTASCYNFPTSIISTTLTATPTTITLPLAGFTTSTTHANPVPGQIVGLQWQVESGAPADPDGGAQPTCTVELRIDDIDFVAQ